MKKKILPCLSIVLVGLLSALHCAAAFPVAKQKGLDTPSHPATWKVGAAHCQIQNNNTGNVLPVDANNDALFKLLSSQHACPQNALLFRDLLIANKLTLRPSMVANRGYGNPLPQGSFSFFEAVVGTFGAQNLVTGDWFFGHFTAASIDNTALTSILSPQQAATQDNLLLETLVWDPSKGMFNFYEIRGTGQGGVWFYRGDSADIQADIRNLDRARDPSQAIFMGKEDAGQATLPRLRCSGCHMNGGPIMKELSWPHDSWWTTERPLQLGAMRIAPEFKSILENLVSANDFAGAIKAGDAKLFASAPYLKMRGAQTLQEQLRPVFCEQEVNLDSDIAPMDASAQRIHAPIGAFIDQRLASDDAKAIVIDKALYVGALTLFQSSFFDYQTGNIANGTQPIDQIDADHGFETPVKSHSDMLLAERMISSGLIDDKFLYDVISVDMTRPMFSNQRCGLLRVIPGGMPTADWQAKFKQNLAHSELPAAKELLANLNDPKRTPAYHRGKAKELVAKLQANANSQGAVNGYVRLLAQNRIAVYQAQISQHPQGQIFEPGFRLIFPTMGLFKKNQDQIAYGGVPGQYWLSPVTGLVELSD